MFARFALRDATLVAVAALVWWIAAHASGGAGPVSDFTGVVAGLLVGATGFVLHEWGHLVGALVTGSAVRGNANLRSSFLFSFDAKRNSLRQFLVMSVGGFVVTGLLVWAFYTFLPDHLLASRVARGVVLFQAFLGVVLELPLVALALAKGAIPEQAAVKVRAPGAPGVA